MSKVFVVYSDDNRVAGIFKNEDDAASCAEAIDGEYDAYTINDDFEEVEYLVIPLSASEYDDVMAYCVEKSVSPAAVVRNLILDEMAR